MKRTMKGRNNAMASVGDRNGIVEDVHHMGGMVNKVMSTQSFGPLQLTLDIALEIVKRYSMLGRKSTLLGVLARKPEAFQEKESNIIERTIKLCDYLYNLMFTTHQSSENNQPEPRREIIRRYSFLTPLEAPPTKKSNIIIRTINSVSEFFVGSPEKETEALQLLRLIWEDIVKLSKKEIDDILRGPPDSIKSGSGTVVQTILRQLIFDHLDTLENEAHKITEGAEHALQLKDFLSKHVVNLHAETQSLVNQYNLPDDDPAWNTQQLISEYVVKILDDTQRIVVREPGKEDQAEKLHNLISYNIAQMRRKTKETYSSTYSSRVMFMAAEVCNTNFLLELIRRSPDLIWKVNDNGLSIFHVAVKNRHEGIYNLLYEIGAMKDMVTPLKDKEGNNMLHLAAISTRKKNLEDVSGAALQMQRELLWFMEVERVIPPSYRERRNNDGLTPRELFTKEHQDLIIHGEKWMKATASQCMVVATLIATIVFAAAFTVPGGYNQNDGIPMFKQKLSFVSFVVADAISLFLSSASILTFLSILTSRYAERDFERSLPMKLMAGLAALFLSIGTMMITFSVSFFVLYHNEMKWIPIFISLFAVTPAILYVALQYHLLIDVFRSTYGGKYLFKPENQVLFYRNPKY
uniref:Ankyrin repeat-containing domain, PGG domain protein n=1 Tax=Tanacetum cinerariifolium TaxID=118510 RepID=A0A6L2LJF5_TANCI|nr:ankyrin repeat-containing domain, PGG domain protein [Tanacetum cinerariifolium]